MSLKDLSELTGEPIPTLSRWETKGGVTVEKLAKVAGALGAEPAKLITKATPSELTADQFFLLDSYAAAGPQTREAIIKVVRALTEY